MFTITGVPRSCPSSSWNCPPSSWGSANLLVGSRGVCVAFTAPGEGRTGPVGPVGPDEDGWEHAARRRTANTPETSTRRITAMLGQRGRNAGVRMRFDRHSLPLRLGPVSGFEQSLDGQALRDVMSRFSAALERHRDELDSLNVYPVPDGDTGTNMLLTQQAVVQAVARLDFRAELGD